MGSPINYPPHPSVAVDNAASVEIAPANGERQSIEIMNTGNHPVYLNLNGGTAVADSSCYALPAGESWFPAGPPPANAITAICAGGQTSTVIIVGG